jgi:hypothetical protein
MLASTVQFSSNDQSPVSAAHTTSTGPVLRRKKVRSLRTQQRARPDQPPSPSTPKQY